MSTPKKQRINNRVRTTASGEDADRITRRRLFLRMQKMSRAQLLRAVERAKLVLEVAGRVNGY